MISSNCDFEKFVRAIRGKDCYEMILLAEKEATEAWRYSYRHASEDGENATSRRYQDQLIGLIDFLRHGLRPGGFNDQDFQLCRQLQNETAHWHDCTAPDRTVNLT